MTQERSIDLGQLFNEAFMAKLSEVNVSLPCKVLAYDAATQTVKLQPLIKRKRRDAAGVVTATEIPPLQEVPVAFPRCAGGWITFPITEGDVGQVVFCQRSIKDWMGKAAGEVVVPTDEDMLSLNGAWFYPGAYPSKTPIAGGADEDNVVIHAEEKLDLGEKGLTADDAVAIAKKVQDNLDTLTDFVMSATSIPAGGALVFVPPTGPIFASMAATKVRAK